MTRTILVVSGGFADPLAWPGLPRPDAERIRACFSADLQELAGRSSATLVQMVAVPTPATLITAALTAGPVVLLSADAPHVPLWRLNDAFTRLADGADVVLGPTDDGSWYLIGLRTAHAELLAALPPPGAALAPTIAAARIQQRHLVFLPPWYRIADLADLEHFGADVRTMPIDTAPHTRALLHHSSHARAVGG